MFSKNFKNCIFLFALLSCTTTYQELDQESTQLTKSDYYSSLAAGYNNLAQKEKRDYDWQSADLFTQKGLAALNRTNVLPENPDLRDLRDQFSRSELRFAYDKLIEITPEEVRLEFPLKSARLMILYDYWLEQTVENWQNIEILRFRDEFWQAYKALNAAILLSKRQEIEQAAPKNFYSIYFDTNLANLDKTAQKELNKVISYLNKLESYQLILEGHTDIRGPAAYNKKLAEQRVKAVHKFLTNSGVPSIRIIREKIYGEEQPAIKKFAGGKKERLNRRVEIYIITRK